MQASKSYMALKVFHEMRSKKCKPNICTFTALVNAFAREGLCEKAEEIFEQLQKAGIEPDVYAYNALMEAYRLISNTVLPSGFPSGNAVISMCSSRIARVDHIRNMQSSLFLSLI